MGDFDSLTDPTAPGATVGVDEMWAALRDVAGGGMPRDSGAVGDAAATTGLRWGIIDSDVNMSVFCVELIERAIDSMENNFGMLDVTDDVKERWIKQILQADAAKREWFGDLNLDRRDEFSEWQYHRELDCWLSPKMCKLAPAVAQLKTPAVAQLKAVDATPRDLSAGVDDSDDVVMALRNVLKMQISDRVSLPRKLVYQAIEALTQS